MFGRAQVSRLKAFLWTPLVSLVPLGVMVKVWRGDCGSRGAGDGGF